MSKNKSLGSSPIGYKTTSNSMGFIPDLGVGNKDSESKRAQKKNTSSKNISSSAKKDEQSKKKKIVSYNLEVGLINQIKELAKQKNMYYSSLVSRALKHWLTEKN